MHQQNKYDLPELPATKKKEFWNPDGQSFQQQIPKGRTRPTPQCGKFKVENSQIVCQKCPNHHTLEVKDIDEFIKKYQELMAPLRSKVP